VLSVNLTGRLVSSCYLAVGVHVDGRLACLNMMHAGEGGCNMAAIDAN